ncbi:hypothetical protein ACIPM1_25195, partial [Streptomyces sp. NPDC086766]
VRPPPSGYLTPPAYRRDHEPSPPDDNPKTSVPAYAPELNPVELLWSSLKKRELANLAGDHLADVADATEQGIHRINANPRLPWSFLAHTGLTLHPPHPPNLRKDQ